MRILNKQLWPHRITINKPEETMDIYYMEQWLEKNLGDFRDQWHVIYKHSCTDFYFKQGSMATAFALKWS